MKNLRRILFPLLVFTMFGLGTSASAFELPKGFENYQKSKCGFRMNGSAIVKIKGLDRSVNLPFYGIMFDKGCYKKKVKSGIFYVPSLSEEPIGTWSDDNENDKIDSGEFKSNVGDEENFNQIVERKLKLKYGY